MGIPRLFYWINATYPQCLIKLKHQQTFEDLNIQVECYALDNNAIIHPVCQKAHGYGNSDPKKSFLHQKPKSRIPPHEKQIFSQLCRKTDELRGIVNPSKRFIFATDGVAGVSKQSQQRQRRFISASTRDKNQTFDSNSITTGSEFMNNLSKYVHINIQRQLAENPEWKYLEVIFSNEKVPGEGEHKIINYMKNNGGMSFCVDSPDADLLMLTLSLPNPKIYIIRENIYKSIDCKYFVVDVNMFREIIIQKFRWGSAEQVYTNTQLIYDFILICFMLGNDFLPHIPSLEISNDGLDVLMDTYPRIATNHGHLVYRSKTTGELSLNTKSLGQLFYSLAQGEKERLLKKSQDKSLDFPDTVLASCITQLSNNLDNLDNLNNLDNLDNLDNPQLDFNKYRKLYYEKKLHDSDPYDVCHEYFKGMLFVIRYYIDGIPDWHYSYSFHKAPFFMDMYESIDDFNGEMKFDQNTPLSSFEQLLAVMPPGSIEILPEALRSLVLDENSPIADFYPDKFEIDLDGKKKEWEGTAILSFLDVKRLKDAYETKKSGLTEAEQRRNQPGKTMRYFNYNDTVRTVFF